VLTADGRSLTRYGCRFIKVKHGRGKKAIIRFEVLSINRPILSVARLRERGYTVNFGKKLYLEREGAKEMLLEIDHMFY
jgi:predicted Zn-dependent protease